MSGIIKGVRRVADLNTGTPKPILSGDLNLVSECIATKPIDNFISPRADGAFAA